MKDWRAFAFTVIAIGEKYLKRMHDCIAHRRSDISARIKCQARSYTRLRALTNKMDKSVVGVCAFAVCSDTLCHAGESGVLTVHPAYTRYQVCRIRRRIVCSRELYQEHIYRDMGMHWCPRCGSLFVR